MKEIFPERNKIYLKIDDQKGRRSENKNQDQNQGI